MRRRVVVIAATCAAMLGLSGVFAGVATAAITHVNSPAPTGLARVCVIAQSADAGLCVHL
ncbi:MAG TPA: hypothetical protein VMZ22_13755 [Acidimicrobiales bacterium]|nr:hypothetical protein [Acidimicrobiales bacterium]